MLFVFYLGNLSLPRGHSDILLRYLLEAFIDCHLHLGPRSTWHLVLCMVEDRDHVSFLPHGYLTTTTPFIEKTILLH